jgi:hypothetical protein
MTVNASGDSKNSKSSAFKDKSKATDIRNSNIGAAKGKIPKFVFSLDWVIESTKSYFIPEIFSIERRNKVPKQPRLPQILLNLDRKVQMQDINVWDSWFRRSSLLVIPERGTDIPFSSFCWVHFVTIPFKNEIGVKIFFC